MPQPMATARQACELRQPGLGDYDHRSRGKSARWEKQSQCSRRLAP